MDWVKNFYSTQNDWFGAYLGDLDASHQLRASLINDMTNPQPKQVLELGAGGGQTAIALSLLGNKVTMLELLEDSALHAKQLAINYNIDMNVLQDDFYTTSLEEKFDVVCYFDSFGIGSDKDQQRLLKRISNWLAPNGSAIIEIGSTWYWGGIGRNKSISLGAYSRHYDFDPIESKLIDKWWPKSNPEQALYQYLRCYTPADLSLLLNGTGLEIEKIESGGKIDYNTLQFIPKVPLADAMTYYVKLVKK